MTKKDLSREIATALAITLTEGEHVYDKLFRRDGVIARSLQSQREVKLGDLGTFKIKRQAEKLGHNPATKEVIHIAAKNVPKFTCSAPLKELVK